MNVRAMTSLLALSYSLYFLASINALTSQCSTRRDESTASMAVGCPLPGSVRSGAPSEASEQERPI